MEDTVSLRLRLISLSPVSSGAMPGRLTTLDDRSLACDRCGISGGTLGEFDDESSALSIPLMLGRIGKRPEVIGRLSGRGVSTLLSLKQKGCEQRRKRVLDCTNCLP